MMWASLLNRYQPESPVKTAPLTRNEICAKARKTRDQRAKERSKEFLDLVYSIVEASKHTGVSTDDLMVSLNVSRSTVGKYLRALHVAEKCWRKPSPRGGYRYFSWRIK